MSVSWVCFYAGASFRSFQPAQVQRERREKFAFNPKLEVAMGSARASRAIFHALAENFERIVKFRGFLPASHAKGLDARRVQPHPEAGVLPNFSFRFQGKPTAGFLADVWQSGVSKRQFRNSSKFSSMQGCQSANERPISIRKLLWLKNLAGLWLRDNSWTS